MQVATRRPIPAFLTDHQSIYQFEACKLVTDPFNVGLSRIQLSERVPGKLVRRMVFIAWYPLPVQITHALG